MTDREYIELAAKAAGMDIEWQPCGWAHDKETGCEWNPLTDDGDAFRLAVQLGVHLTNSDTDAWASTLGTNATEPLGEDPLAATRRAITRAAAEIGKGMK